MANKKIRDLDAASSLADADIIEVTVDPSGTPASKKATVAQVRTAVLPTGTNGAVLARVGGAWVSSGAGTSGQHLKSNGSGAPTWETPVAVPSPADFDPAPLGGADPGSSDAYSRADHVHPMPNALDVGALNLADGPPTSEEWYAAAKEAWTLAAMLPTANATNTTTGFPFRVASTRSILGARFFWNHATAVTVRISLWNSAGTLLATKDVAVSGIGDFTGTFTSSVSLSAGSTYWLGIWETSGARCMPGVSGSTSARFRVAPEPYRGWIRLGGYCSATGNARPSTAVLVEQPMLLVPLF